MEIITVNRLHLLEIFKSYGEDCVEETRQRLEVASNRHTDTADVRLNDLKSVMAYANNFGGSQHSPLAFNYLTELMASVTWK